MKNWMMLSIIFFFTLAISAQPYSLVVTEEPLLTPESQLSLQDGDYARNLTGAELKEEFKRYEEQAKIDNGAYTQLVEPEKTILHVPLSNEVQMALKQQSELFYARAIDAQSVNLSVREAVDNYEMKIGYNQVWGKQDRFAAYVDALMRIYGARDSRALESHFNAGGYVFNYQVKAVEFNLNMNNTGSGSTANTSLKIFGKTKFSSSATLIYTKTFFQDEFGKSVRFFIGPVPVSVRGAIGGSAGFEANVSVVEGGVKGQVTPGITSYGKADAGVDLWFVKAGVEGKLDLLIDYLPVSLTVRLLSDYKTLEAALNVTNQLKALAGKISVFAKVKEFWKFWSNSWKTYSMTLFSWNGIEKTWVLYAKSVKVQLK